ncbi:MAG: ribonuclease Z [Planctomycetota bacterium]|jgi:ribonuclease Z
MDLLGLEVSGLSRGGIETCLQVPTWKLAFDMGRCPRTAVNLSTVLFTHAHVDHMGAVASHCATRELWGLPPAQYVVPPPVAKHLESLLEVWRELDGARFDAKVVRLAPDESMDLGGGRTVTALRTVHRVVSQAYVISGTRKRLRPDLTHLSGPEIVDLKRQGEQVDEISQVDELAFSGDTCIEGLLKHERLMNVRRLMLEVTFLDERVSVEQSREMGHIHLDEVVANADAFQNEQLVFLHRSMRYSNQEAGRLISRSLPESLRGRVQIFKND